ncbi:MAG: sulfurtransferase TusA family protein [Dehalococcoidia bacterium]|nr:sulfurtransferase TusA family protein [Dehalococcoidia bacterium]
MKPEEGWHVSVLEREAEAVEEDQWRKRDKVSEAASRWKSDRTLDCLGHFCPMPVIRTRQAMDEMAVGQILEIWSDDRAAEEDIQRWAKRTGQELLGLRWEKGRLIFRIRKSH